MDVERDHGGLLAALPAALGGGIAPGVAGVLSLAPPVGALAAEPPFDTWPPPRSQLASAKQAAMTRAARVLRDEAFIDTSSKLHANCAGNRRADDSRACEGLPTRARPLVRWRPARPARTMGRHSKEYA